MLESQIPFLQRLELAERGQWLLYHTGYLYEDRTKSSSLDGMANTVYASYLDKRTALVQRRLGAKNYLYYAVVL